MSRRRSGVVRSITTALGVGLPAALIVTGVALVPASASPHASSVSLLASSPLDGAVHAPLAADTKSLVSAGTYGLPPSSTPAAKVSGFDPAKSAVVARTATTDTYANPDGTRTLKSSESLINYQDPKAGWQPIVNTLENDPDQAGGLTNTANSWRVHFGSSSQGVAVDTAAGSLSIAPVGAAANVVPVEDSSGDGVTYADVWPGADVDYQVTGGSVKETVLIKSALAGSQFSFATQAGSKSSVLAGLAAALPVVSRGAGLVPTGALGSLVAFNQPLVVAADGRPITDANATLTSVGGRLILSVDPAWLAAQPASAFPIRVDPTVVVGEATTYSDKSDGYTCTNCGIQVGNSRDSNTDKYWRSISQYSFPASTLAGSTIVSAQIGTNNTGGTTNAYPMYAFANVGYCFNCAVGNDVPLASGTPGANGPLNDTGGSTGLVYWLQNTIVAAGVSSAPLGFAGYEAPGLYSYQRYDTAIYVTYDHPPTAAPAAGSSPGNQGVVATPTPTLAVPAASDPDGDTVQYNFTISGSGDRNGRASSGWQTATSWTVPSGVLQDGQSYSWSVATYDGTLQTAAAWSQTLTVNQRLGASQVTPSDSLGGVSVNLANGNANVEVAAHTMATVGGALGVGFSYNSQAAANFGLLGQYYADPDRQWNFATAGQPALVRVDPTINFVWGWLGAAAAPPGLPTAQYLIRWTGYLTVPTSGTYQLGMAADDGAKIFVGGSQVYANWPGSPSTGWSSTVTLTGGTPTPVEIDYDNQTGPATAVAYIQGAGSTSLASEVIPTTWLSPGVSTLPAGWTLSLPGGDSSYTHAAVTSASVVLTDGSGGTHTYPADGHGGYSAPAGEDGVLSLSTPTGAGATATAATVTLKDSDGTVYTFDPTGNPLTVTSATDTLHPAAAVYSYDTTVTPPRAKTVTDPVSGQSINLYYGADASCGTSPSGYDAAAPPTMLCGVTYWDGTTTHLYYASGQLAAIVEPGSEQELFGYAGGLLSSVEAPLAVDWQNAGTGRGGAPVTTTIAYQYVAPPAGGTQTNVRAPYTPVSPNGSGQYPAGSIPLVTSVTAPSPDGGTSTARPQHAYTYPTASSNETQVHIAGLSTTVDEDVTYDAAGRTLTTTTATGQSSSSAWDAGGQDLPVSTTDAAGRTSTTVYDWALRATDTYGPAPTSCFQASGFPVTSLPTSCGTIPHTHDAFDTDTSGALINGLETEGWSNPSESGAPTTRLTTTPRTAGWTTATQTALGPSGRSDQYSGDIALATGTDTFSATVGDPANDGIRVFVDGQPVVDRWTTTRQAVLGDQATDFWRLGDPAGSTSAANQGTAATAGAATNVTFGGSGPGPVDTTTSGSFNGSTSKVVVPSSAVPTGAGAVTVEAWVKPAVNNVAQNVVTKYDPAGTYVDPYDLRLNANGQVEFVQGNGGAWSVLTSASVIPTGSWTHLVATSAGGVATIYVNGSLDATSPANAFPGTPANDGASVYVGGRPDGVLNFNGSIANVALYGTALTTTQISTHFQAGTATLGAIPGSSPVTFTAAAPVAPGSLPAARPSTPHQVRVDYRNPVATASFSLSATPSGGSAAPIPDTAFTPRYGLDSRTVVDDAGGLPGGAETTATSYTGSGLDPVYGLATDNIVDPGGLNLDTKTSYESPGTSGFLRKTASALPSASLSNAAQATTVTYYGNQDPRSNPCTSGSAVNQAGLPKITTSPTPASGTAVQTEVVYDAAGRVVASRVVGDGANWTCTTYDTRGRTTTVAYPAVNGAPARTVTTNWAVGGDPLTTSVTDPAGTITTRVDLVGRTVSYTDTKGVVTTTSYDQAGRDTADTTTAPGGGTSTIATAYLDDGRVSRVSLDGLVIAVPAYDSAAQLTGVSYPTGSGDGGNGGSLGNMTRDPQGRETAQLWTLPGSHSVGDSLGLSQAGKIVSDTQSVDGVTNAAWSYGYDAAARLTSASLAAAGARPQVAYTYGFAASGGCGADAAAGQDSARSSSTVKVGTGALQTTTSCTDYASRLTSASGASPLASATYNGHGDATAMDNRTFSYDSSDRTTGMAITGATSQSLAYTLDATGRVTHRVATGTGTGAENDTIDYGYTSDNDSPDLQLTTAKTIAERYISLPGGVLLTHRYGGTTPDDWALPNLHGDVVATTGPTGTLTGSAWIHH